MCISTPRSNLVVRFLSVFLLCCTSLYASTDQTGKQKVTVVGNNVTLGEVFKQIEKQTGLRFMYAVDAVDVKERVTVAFEKVALDSILENLFGQKEIEWGYRDSGIFLRRKIENKPTNSNSIALPLINILGKVTDVNGNPVPGATVMVKGSKKGTKTDSDGIFILNGLEPDAILLVRSLGFENKEVQVNAGKVIVKMNETIGTLGETVVKGGYYNTTSRLNTGNVTSIKAQDIEKQPVTDPLLALQGRVPGMTIVQSTGMQGGEVKVQIRGQNSLINGTQPLFIVDGIPYNPSIVGSFGSVGRTLSTLSFVNPADIESIDVLKDADATAIYGSRGANGVVLITTKKGKSGVTKMDINVYKGWADVSREIEFLSTQQYLKMRHSAFRNDGVLPTILNAPDLLLWDSTRNTNWQKELIGRTASYSDLKGVISGGNSSVKYLIGGNYHTEGTIFPGDFSSKNGGGHFNIKGNSLDERFETSLTGSYLVRNTNFPGGDYVSNINLPPNAPSPFNEDGSLNWENSTWTNPYAQLYNGIFESRTSNLIGSVDVRYRILPGLQLKTNFGFNELLNNVFSARKIAGINPQFQNNATASANYLTTKTRSWIFEPQVDYQKMIGSGTFNVLIGGTFLENNYDQQTLVTSGISDDALVRNPASAVTFSAGGSGSKYKYMAIFGRIGYNFADKYLVNLTMRRDGSSRFGPRRQYANLGAVGVGWLFSEEKFTKTLLPILSYGKIRFSYGTTGNDQIGDYQYLDRYVFQESLYQGVKGLQIVGIYNPEFAWELTKKGELGLELGFWKDRLFLSGSYYSNSSSNQLIEYAQPSTIGASSMLGNLPAKVKNEGWECVVTSRNLSIKNFEWTTSLNISFSSNKVVSYTDRAVIPIAVGRSLSSRNLYKVSGVDKQTGEYLFFDNEGKPVPFNQANSAAVVIDLAPSAYGGIQNSIKYKQLSLDIFFQYSIQHGFSGLFSPAWVPGSRRNQPIDVMSNWQEAGDEARYQRFSQSAQLRGSYSNWLNSDRAYVNASFIRCKNISLSWQLPQKWNRRLHLNSSRIYFQGQNLFTITKYPGWDPETQVITGIPPLRVVTIGCQLLF